MIKIILLIAVCIVFFIFEHNAPHHQPVTKRSSEKEKEELEKTGWMRE